MAGKPADRGVYEPATYTLESASSANAATLSSPAWTAEPSTAEPVGFNSTTLGLTPVGAIPGLTAAPIQALPAASTTKACAPSTTFF